MEFLSRCFMFVERNDVIRSVKVTRRAPLITHLLFADDILIFGDVSMNHIDSFVLDILHNFGKYSGQLLNFNKSCVHFSGNLSPEDCVDLAKTLDMTMVNDSEKYLGAPLLLGRSKLKSFDPISQCCEARLKNWVSVSLNQAGRYIMIKSVLNSLPTYQMGYFKIPSTIIKKLDSLQRNFWWGHRANKGIKFIAWSNLYKSKDLGGPGFRNLELFNQALICKMAWKLGTERDELWVQIMEDKYFRDVSFLNQDNISDTSSWIWKAGTRTWNAVWINNVFHVDTTSKILSVHVPQMGVDTLIWTPDKKGVFSVKSAYNILNSRTNTIVGNHSIPSSVWIALWRTKLPHKVKLFVWKCLKDIVPSRSINVNMNNVLARHDNLLNWILSLFDTASQQQPLCFAGISMEPPVRDCYKINIDASFVKETLEGGVGLIMRDFAGDCKGAKGKRFYGGLIEYHEVKQLKCLAMNDAVCWAVSKGLASVVFESDNEALVKSINEQTSYVHWRTYGLILDIKLILESHAGWSFSLIRRFKNGVADFLEKKAYYVCF
ncbi:uncharacterized protein LOC113350104 [Papaver somniferum]|uniref:uncharacterized protein LOC113350104 n=1 Tax=Papaver somniferum TaxID=3469 RepID=UPI000E6FC5C6|nr:uncharacterized protein LOC113350104 [Papaver somniferum]